MTGKNPLSCPLRHHYRHSWRLRPSSDRKSKWPMTIAIVVELLVMTLITVIIFYVMTIMTVIMFNVYAELIQTKCALNWYKQDVWKYKQPICTHTFAQTPLTQNPHNRRIRHKFHVMTIITVMMFNSYVTPAHTQTTCKQREHNPFVRNTATNSANPLGHNAFWASISPCPIIPGGSTLPYPSPVAVAKSFRHWRELPAGLFRHTISSTKPMTNRQFLVYTIQEIYRISKHML